MSPRVGAAVLKARYIRGPMVPYAIGSQTLEVGRVYIASIDVPWPVIIDRIAYQVGAASVGNVRMGIYREGATADSPAGGALVVESASVAQGTANCVQMVTVADTLLIPGQYFAVMQGSDATGTHYRSTDAAGIMSRYYDRAGGYGAFTDPCPTSAANNVLFWCMLRVKENLPAGYRL